MLEGCCVCAVASTVAKLAQASESEDLAFRDFLKETCGRAVSAYEPRSGRASLQEHTGRSTIRRHGRSPWIRRSRRRRKTMAKYLPSCRAQASSTRRKRTSARRVRLEGSLARVVSASPQVLCKPKIMPIRPQHLVRKEQAELDAEGEGEEEEDGEGAS